MCLCIVPGLIFLYSYMNNALCLLIRRIGGGEKCEDDASLMAHGCEFLLPGLARVLILVWKSISEQCIPNYPCIEHYVALETVHIEVRPFPE